MPETRKQVCACCGDGVPVGVVPFGALKGKPACDACLRACGEDRSMRVPPDFDSDADVDEVYAELAPPRAAVAGGWR